MIARRRDAWLALLLSRCLPGRRGGEIRFCLADAVFDDGAAVFPGQVGKARAEVPVGVRAGMVAGGNGVSFCPAQELVRRDHRLPDLAGLGAGYLHLFREFGRMGQEKPQIEGARFIEEVPGCFQVALLAGIGPLLISFPEIQLQFRGPLCLSHQILAHPP